MLANKQGYLMNLRVPTDDFSMEYIKQMEQECIDIMIKENANWFDNALDEAKIRSLLDSCISDIDSLQVYSSVIRSNAIINGANVSVEEWLYSRKTQLPNEASLSIVCDGMFVYPDKFGLRWIIKDMRAYNDEPEICEIVPELSELVIYWKERSIQYLTELNLQKDALNQKIMDVDKKIEDVQHISLALESPFSNLSELEKEISRLKETMDSGHFYKNILSEIVIV